MFDENFCLQNRFYDNTITFRKQNELYLFIKNFQNEIIESISTLNTININEIMELESYKSLQDMKNNQNITSIVKSNFFLHKLENINAVLQDIKTNLKPNGLFYGTFFGNDNIKDFAMETLNLQQKLCSQIYPMVLPTIDIKVLGMMLNSIGFKNVSVVSVKKSFNFSSIKDMLNFMRIIGGTNCIQNRRKTILPKAFFEQINNLNATFEVLVFTCQT